MFKKGQLIRNRMTGTYLAVIDWPTVRVYFSRHHVTASYGASHYELIGNNYQAKQKCSR